MKNSLLREITPLTQSDCFTLFSRVKSEFDFPLHYHEEFELNFIQNAKNARRVIGDHIEDIDELELVLVGSNLQHAWFTHHCKSNEIREITIQFHKDLFDEKLLRRNQLSFIRTMLEKSLRGILFSKETTQQLAPRIMELNQKQGFDSVLELMSILHDLSISRNMRILSDATFNNTEQFTYNSRRIEKTLEYMNHNFDKPITLNEVARLANMSDAAFSRFFKQRTGNTFIDSLTEIRLGHASRMLIDTTQSIAEVAYHCGFNNISNFNRIFKKKKSCTPKDFRESFSGTRIFI
ncbi:transcriptional regulator [Niastella koreensis]|uniref:Transcriptional regulator, AraC family n=2 Tax=Niastella koreensis TaxID=354356 RepID=G8TH47_NIAKG|nr:AraC family transcriptional regulator [Niastella koreensis]AEW00658.1 transcriptional regulator, AraC family [Niastella koreensis GR20-10]OQP42289.1 transcriptional regulator [Niastella koreensis]